MRPDAADRFPEPFRLAIYSIYVLLLFILDLLVVRRYVIYVKERFIEDQSVLLAISTFGQSKGPAESRLGSCSARVGEVLL